MTIDYKVTIGHPLETNEIDIVKNIIKATFDEVDEIYNRWNPKSELSRLNKSRSIEPIQISDKLYNLLSYAAKFVKISEGRFDPTVEPLVVLWKSKLEKNEIPSDEELMKVRSYVGWNHIHLDDHFFRKDHHLTEIDLGGIAKGYAVDLVTENLLKAGYKNLLVDWGGEIRASGMHPENRAWKIFISRLNDMNPDHSLAEIVL
ncbi:MAG: FAD:protein FMN transferase, partial [Parachlamydiaceae bacterium]